MSVQERRVAGVRDFKSVKVKKEVAAFIKDILEPLLDSGVALTDVIDLLAVKWEVYPTFEGLTPIVKQE
jgi:hypothetical protein